MPVHPPLDWTTEKEVKSEITKNGTLTAVTRLRLEQSEK